MRDKDLYAKILGLDDPWQVSEVHLDTTNCQVEIVVENMRLAELSCPECMEVAPCHDHRERRWRHLDTCQYKTILVARVPRVKCAVHGVRQVAVPWSDPGSRFTALFEALAIDWLKEANISAVARLLGISWDQVDGIMRRAVERGLARRPRHIVEDLEIDETAYRKRHDYVSVVSGRSDTDSGKAIVLHIADDRKTDSLDPFFRSLDDGQMKRLRSVSMDMWKPFINVVKRWVPGAHDKIAFDKFHIAQHLGNAVDKVRRQENRELLKGNERALVGSKHLWLQNPQNMKNAALNVVMSAISKVAKQTARAWEFKERAMTIWDTVGGDPQSTMSAWRSWIHGAIRSNLAPVKASARMVRDHLWGVLNAIRLGVTNAGAESMNARIQKVKKISCGFRNKDRFKNAIYFHLGGLRMYPDTHPRS